MTSPNPTQLDGARSMSGGALTAEVSADVATMPVGLTVFAPMVAFSVVCDSIRLLSAFAWSKEGRLSSKNSANLCDLMNSWN